jgi:hypothetical protein
MLLETVEVNDVEILSCITNNIMPTTTEMATPAMLALD